MNKVYQNIMVDGIEMGVKPERGNSAFYNEGKWNNFINPLLPDDCINMTFVEFGCNAGLFLKLAKLKGFKTVIGIDKSNYACKKAIRYRDENGMDYQVRNERVDGNFNYSSLPLADITLLANFHYHLQITDFILLLDMMKSKTCYCLVVTADVENTYCRAESDFNSLRHYFRDWEEVSSVYPLSIKDDSTPRNMSSILFKSDLKRKSIDSIWEDNINDSRFSERAGHTTDLVKRVIEYEVINDIKSLPSFKVREGYYSEERIINHLRHRIDALYDIKKNGMRTPIFIRSDGRLVDGLHRLCLLRELGYKSIVCRQI